MNTQDFLRQKKVAFEALEHAPTFDAQHLAQSVATSGHEVAKTVLLRNPADGASYAVAVLPASKAIDLPRAGEALGWREAELATEVEMHKRFGDCEIGALPPFGSRYEMPTIVDEGLAERDQITFEGSRHDTAIRMKFDDYRNVEHPTLASFVC